MKKACNLMMLVMAAEKHCKPMDLSTAAKTSTQAESKQVQETDTVAQSVSEVEQYEDTAAEKSVKFGCAHGSRVYRVKLHHENLMKTAQN